MKYLSIMLSLLVVSHSAVAATWQSMLDTSRLSYTATYEGQPIEGVIKQFSVHYLDHQQLVVMVDMRSVDMGNSDINDTIKTADWFDVTQFPQTQFIADKIEKIDGTHFIAKGELTLKGVKKSLVIPLNWQLGKKGATLSGQVILKRSDYAIGSGQWVSGDEIGIDVTVKFEVVLKEKIP